ncbi:MAG: tryptophan-rich sensory protein [Beijerinckiaceae bacterium]|nr:tryptophan-rich sensory protein [Beijerinckiaceae bacterium]
MTADIERSEHHPVADRVPRYLWWHGVLFWFAVNAPGFLIGWRERLFTGFRVPPLRPPGAFFPVIWFVITICTIQAGMRILNNRQLPHRRLHLWLQGLFWLDFAIFPYFFFAKSSTIIGGVLTQAIFLLALAEVMTLWRDDRAAAKLMLPLLAWGAFAGLYVSTWQMLHNPDPYLGLPAVFR